MSFIDDDDKNAQLTRTFLSANEDFVPAKKDFIILFKNLNCLIIRSKVL